MNISIIIPNYNGETLLKNNLPKVIDAAGHYKQGKVEIIIVDDASTDNSTSLLSHFANSNSHIKVLHNSKNLGFSSTVNKGVAVSCGELVVLLNTDVIPDKEFLTKTAKHFADEKVFAVGFMDESTENGKIVLRGRGIGRWHKGFMQHSRGDIDKTNTLWASGGSSAFRKSVWEELGGLCELYNPFYWEDIDISYRALKCGYTVIFDKAIAVKHEHEKGAIRSYYTAGQIKTIAYRNQILFVWLNITEKTYIISHVLWLPYYCTNTLLSGDVSFLRGLFAALRTLLAVVRIRTKNKKLFIRTDTALLNTFNS